MEAILGFLLILIGAFELNRRKQARKLEDANHAIQREKTKAELKEQQAKTETARDKFRDALDSYQSGRNNGHGGKDDDGQD